jgi:hypothetical protein
VTADITTRATAALDALGHTADEVADQLRAKGIKGERLDEGACPIANYLSGIDGVIDVDVIEKRTWIGVDHSPQMIEVVNPDAITTFVSRFDRGVYLDLVAVA